jgi:ABC-type uncharacterized transport system auxiliary subunit
MQNLKYLLVISLFVFGSCSSNKTLTTKYYVIEHPTNADTLHYGTNTPLDTWCEIVPVEISPAFAVQQIASRTNSHEIIYYNQHQWAVRPESFFTQMLVEHFTENRLFAGAATRFWRINPDYKLQTTVYKLESVNQNNQLAAHLELKFVLMDTQSNKPICEHSANRTELLQERSLNFFAAAIGTIFHEELQAFSEQISKELRPKKED